MAKRKQTDPRKLELSDLQTVASTDAGKRVLGRFIAQSGMMNGVFHEQERLHVFAEGQRHLGIWMYNELKDVYEELPFIILKEYYYARSNGHNGNKQPDFREPGADNPDIRIDE